MVVNHQEKNKLELTGSFDCNGHFTFTIWDLKTHTVEVNKCIALWCKDLSQPISKESLVISVEYTRLKFVQQHCAQLGVHERNSHRYSKWIMVVRV